MSRSSIEALPESIQKELGRRYLEERSLTLDDHVSWLLDQGYTVSRSSLHRYLSTRKDSLLLAEETRSEMVVAEETLRFRCLEIASSMYKGSDQLELIGLAEELIDWIQTTDSSRLPVV